MKITHGLGAKLIIVNLAVVVAIFILSYSFIHQLNKIENLSVNKLNIIHTRTNTLYRLQNSFLNLEIKTQQLTKKRPAKGDKKLTNNLEQFNKLILAAKNKGGIDLLQLEKITNSLQGFAIDYQNLSKLITQVEQLKADQYQPNSVKVKNQLILLLDSLYQSSNTVDAQKINTLQTVLHDSTVLLRGDLNLQLLTKLKLKGKGISQASFTHAQQVLFNNYQLSLNALMDTSALLLKKVQQKEKIAQVLQEQHLAQLHQRVSALLSTLNKSAEQYEAFNQKAITSAKYNAWILGSLFILLSSLIGWYLRKQILIPLQDVVTMMGLLASADFKKIQNLAKNELLERVLRADVFGQLSRACLNSAKYQQRMIFDIDTACQGLALGFLDQHTSFEYQGEYKLVEHTLNASKDNVKILIEDTANVCEAIANGKLIRTTKPHIYAGSYSAINESLQCLVDNLKNQFDDTVLVTRSMVQGLAQKNDFVNPGEHYCGDQLKVKATLEYTVSYLQDFAQENIDQNWLKSGISEMNRSMSGEQPLDVLTKNSVDFIAHYFDAPVAYIYRSFEDQSFGRAIRLIAHYGILMDDETKATRYKFVYPEGVGLIGQVFINPEIIVKKLSEEERLPISQSGIANAMINYVAVLPLIHEGHIEGVLELGLYEPLSYIQKEFLMQVISNLGIAMNVAVSRDRMSTLLEQSQRQAEKLEIQQSQLGNSNEMLQLKAQELEDKQEAVENKNHQLEQASFVMEEKAKELILASKYKSEFLANMSHELRSPLNSLLILSKLLIDNSKQHLDASEVNYAQVIYRSGTDLMQLIEDILDLSKIEAGKTDLHYEAISLANIVNHVSQRFDELATQKGLEFVHDFENAPSVIEVDEKSVVQIVTNLLSNAFKFTIQGKISLVVSVLQEGESYIDSLQQQQRIPFDSLCFSITDTGIGIAQENREHIFQAFQQADGTTSRKFGGTGLGLTITSHLVELMGGLIHFQSELEQGTTFVIYLPLRKISSQRAPALKEIDIKPQAATRISANDMLNSAHRDIPAMTQKPVKLTHTSTEPSYRAADNNSVSAIKMSENNTQTILILASDDAMIERLTSLIIKRDYLVTVINEVGDMQASLEAQIPAAIVFRDDELNTNRCQVTDLLAKDLRTQNIPILVISTELADATFEINKVEDKESDERAVLVQLSDHLDAIRKSNQTEITLCSKNEAFITTFKNGYSANITQSTAREQLDLFISLPSKMQKSLTDGVLIDANQQKSIELINYIVEENAQSPIPIIVFTLNQLRVQDLNIISKIASRYPITIITAKDALDNKVLSFLYKINNKVSVNQQDVMQDYLECTKVLAGKKVLIVDDNISNVFALSAVLESNDMAYVIAQDGNQAIASTNEHNDIDLILMDIMMPELDGYQAMKGIRENPHYQLTPIIALTAKAMPEDRNKCLRAGANDYMTKPLDTQKLIKMMKIWLATSMQNEALNESDLL